MGGPQILHFFEVLFRLVALELGVFEAEVFEFELYLIIVIFRGMGRRSDNEAAAEGEVFIVFPA